MEDKFEVENPMCVMGGNNVSVSRHHLCGEMLRGPVPDGDTVSRLAAITYLHQVLRYSHTKVTGGKVDVGRDTQTRHLIQATFVCSPHVL